MKNVMKRINDFTEERDWDQFHTPVNLSKSIVIEAAELLECFQWSDNGSIEDIKDELADILIYSLQLAQKLDLDIETIILDKMDKNEQKYDVARSKGNSKKYTEL